MTRANPLVIEGGEVKLRLMAERTAHKTPVHVDWVRFTCLLRNAPTPSADALFPMSGNPMPLPDRGYWRDCDQPLSYRQAQWAKVLKDIPNAEFVPSAQALDLAHEICKALGRDFSVFPEIRKGHDFYKSRWSIERAGAECGWVGFLASGDSPRQSAQALTIHANLYGHACTFAEPGWNHRIADILDAHDAKLTRADLALDFFDGMQTSMDALPDDYRAGLFDVNGKRPNVSQAGDWINGAERSLYIGSKQAGKQTNVYEKGDQLFGRDSNSPWVRVELRYGNKLRVLPTDMLRNPGDFFAGASDWHALQLAQADHIASARTCPTEKALPVQTVKAEVTRNIRWAMNTAKATIATCFEFMSLEEFHELINWKVTKRPGRLQRFSKNDLAQAFTGVMSTFSTVESTGPAFA